MAYTPGLIVTENTIVKKMRLLPLLGDVLVTKGDYVNPETDVAHCLLPGDIEAVKVSSILDIEPNDIEGSMLKKIGDEVEKDEIIATVSYLFGFWKKTCVSPIKGTVERISNISGQVHIRGLPHRVTLTAYLQGNITKVIHQKGVMIETQAALIQCIFGICGESYGEIHMVAETPDDEITADMLGPDCFGKIIIGGSMVTLKVLNRAIEVGAKGLIVGGMNEQDLLDLLGYEIGVAITGHEEVGLTLILTEGFGKMRMSQKTFSILKKNNGKLACINGTTQIRAGVQRPEIIIPVKVKNLEDVSEDNFVLEKELAKGTPIRIIREPYFGSLGHVVDLPIELRVIGTESKVRVLKAKLDDGRMIIVPRANVEMIDWEIKQ